MLPDWSARVKPVPSMKRLPPPTTTALATLRFGPSHAFEALVNSFDAGDPFVPVFAQTVYWQPVGPCLPTLGRRFSTRIEYWKVSPSSMAVSARPSALASGLRATVLV